MADVKLPETVTAILNPDYWAIEGILNRLQPKDI